MLIDANTEDLVILESAARLWPKVQYLTNYSRLNRGEDCGRQWREIALPIGPRVQDDHGDAGVGDVLLVREISVDCDEQLKAGSCHEAQQFPITAARPSLVSDGRNFVSRQRTPEPARDALVE